MGQTQKSKNLQCNLLVLIKKMWKFFLEYYIWFRRHCDNTFRHVLKIVTRNNIVWKYGPQNSDFFNLQNYVEKHCNSP